MSKNQTPENDSTNAISDETIKKLMDQAGETIKKSVPAQATEEPTAEEKLTKYAQHIGGLSNEIADAMLAGDKDRVEFLVTASMKVMDDYRGVTGNGDDTEKTSKIEDLKSKAQGLIKNKKFLIGAGAAVAALGVVVKIALGKTADEEPVQVEDDSDENIEAETDSV